MRHQHLPGYFGPPPRHCACCGAVERQSGCVLGFPCRCHGLALQWCKVCQKCPEHCQCHAMDKGEDIALVVRKRNFHGDAEFWWIGRGNGKDFVPYADEHCPVGYAFKSKAKAEKRAAEIEEQLRSAATPR